MINYIINNIKYQGKRKVGFTKKPEFLIIGAQKAATTSLHNYLVQHPSIKGPLEKEIRFFNRDDNYKRGTKWYHQQFKKTFNPFRSFITFEATPEYSYYPNSAERIYNYNKHMKLVFILREPIARAYSAWNMYKQFNENGGDWLSFFEKPYLTNIDNNLANIFFSGKFPSFDEAITEELKTIKMGGEQYEPSLVRRGIYFDQLSRYFQYFDRSQVLLIGFGDVKTDLVNQLNRVLTFIGLPEYNWGLINKEYANKRSYDGKISQETLEKLSTFYSPHNQKLMNLVDRPLNW